MADGVIQVSPDSTGAKVDTESLTVAAQTVHRQRIRLAGLAAAELAAVKLGSDQPDGLYGLLTRQSPQGFSRVLTTTPLGIGGVYTSPWFDMNEIGAAHIWWLAKSDVASAAGGIDVEVSPDQSYVFERSPHTYSSTDPGLGNPMFRDAIPWFRYWRIKYTNGGTAQGNFLLSVFFSQSLLTAHDSIGRAVIQGDHVDGIAHSYFSANASGKLPTLPVRTLSGLASWGADLVTPLHTDTSGRLWTVGDGVLHDAADSAAIAPLRIGGKASLNEPTAVADDDRVNAWLDRHGRQVVIEGHANPENPVTASASAAGASVIAAPGAGVSLYVKKGSIHNRAAAAQVASLRDGSGGTIRWTAELAPDGGGSIFDFGSRGWKLTANTALVCDAAAASVDINVTDYYIAP